jgi:hypothetical protein
MYETTTARYQGIAKRLLKHQVVKWWVHGKTRACSQPPYHSHTAYQAWVEEAISAHLPINIKPIILDKEDDIYDFKHHRGYIVFGLEAKNSAP